MEGHFELDADSLRHNEMLDPGEAGHLRLSGLNGQLYVFIAAEDEGIRVACTASMGIAPAERMLQFIGVAWSACRFGGQRAVFICPGSTPGDCGRRYIKLYGIGRRFLCRRCHGLAYASHSHPRAERKRRQANRLRVSLGARPGALNPGPTFKPHGMHATTFERHRCRLADLEREVLQDLAGNLPRPRR